jgi:hypothetical protein
MIVPMSGPVRPDIRRVGEFQLRASHLNGRDFQPEILTETAPALFALFREKYGNFAGQILDGLPVLF